MDCKNDIKMYDFTKNYGLKKYKKQRSIKHALLVLNKS